jgi:hypothetical protein
MEAHLIKDLPAWDRKNSGNVHALSIVRPFVPREPALKLHVPEGKRRKLDETGK